MKIQIEKEILGSLLEEQGDSTLAATENVSREAEKYGWILNEKEDTPYSRDYASFSYFFNPGNNCYTFLHWQAGHVSFPANSRYYTTRCMYEISDEKIKETDYNFIGLINALPRMKKQKEKDYSPTEFIDVKDANVSNHNISEILLSAVLKSIEENLQVYIKLDDNYSDYYENKVLDNKKLSSLISTLHLLPKELRRYIGIAFSVDKASSEFLDNCLIIAYHKDMDIPDKSILLNWESDELKTKDVRIQKEDLSETKIEQYRQLALMVPMFIGNMDYSRNTIFTIISTAKTQIDNMLKLSTKAFDENNFKLCKSIVSIEKAYRYDDVKEKLIEDYCINSSSRNISSEQFKIFIQEEQTLSVKCKKTIDNFFIGKINEAISEKSLPTLYKEYGKIYSNLLILISQSLVKFTDEISLFRNAFESVSFSKELETELRKLAKPEIWVIGDTDYNEDLRFLYEKGIISDNLFTNIRRQCISAYILDNKYSYVFNIKPLGTDEVKQFLIAQKKVTYKMLDRLFSNKGINTMDKFFLPYREDYLVLAITSLKEKHQDYTNSPQILEQIQLLKSSETLFNKLLNSKHLQDIDSYVFWLSQLYSNKHKTSTNASLHNLGKDFLNASNTLSELCEYLLKTSPYINFKINDEDFNLTSLGNGWESNMDLIKQTPSTKIYYEALLTLKNIIVNSKKFKNWSELIVALDSPNIKEYLSNYDGKKLVALFLGLNDYNDSLGRESKIKCNTSLIEQFIECRTKQAKKIKRHALSRLFEDAEKQLCICYLDSVIWDIDITKKERSNHNNVYKIIVKKYIKSAIKCLDDKELQLYLDFYNDYLQTNSDSDGNICTLFDKSNNYLLKILYKEYCKRGLTNEDNKYTFITQFVNSKFKIHIDKKILYIIPIFITIISVILLLANSGRFKTNEDFVQNDSVLQDTLFIPQQKICLALLEDTTVVTFNVTNPSMFVYRLDSMYLDKQYIKTCKIVVIIDNNKPDTITLKETKELSSIMTRLYSQTDTSVKFDPVRLVLQNGDSLLVEYNKPLFSQCEKGMVSYILGQSNDTLLIVNNKDFIKKNGSKRELDRAVYYMWLTKLMNDSIKNKNIAY